MLFSESLKKNTDFRNVYKNGRSYADKYLVMYVLENNKGINRLGISASRKVGNSVVRHRFVRLVRESYRLHENIFNSGLDIVVVARKSAASVGFLKSKAHCYIFQNFIILSKFIFMMMWKSNYFGMVRGIYC